MRPFTIAGKQMKVSATHSNVEMMKLKMDIAMSIHPAIDMILFSELAGYGPLTYLVQEFPGEFEREMEAIEVKHGISLLPGSVFEEIGDLIYNTASVIDPQGNIVAPCRNMFPFYPYEVGVTSRNEFSIFDVPEVGVFDVSICYDMSFPETVRTLTGMKAEVILHPAMMGTMDRDMEHSIAQTKAAVNQCFFFDINGLEAGGIGRSTVCGPDSRIVFQTGSTEEITPIEIDMERAQRSRELGVMRLGQPMNSFRDYIGNLNVYTPRTPLPYLDKLGPLIKPSKLDIISAAIEKQSEVMYPETP
jgi:predicted amidohydrolase